MVGGAYRRNCDGPRRQANRLSAGHSNARGELADQILVSKVIGEGWSGFDEAGHRSE